jgi:hypothetical protein
MPNPQARPPEVWAQVRKDYEAGMSQRSLSLKYGIAQPVISRRARAEHWIVTIRPETLLTAANADLSESDEDITAKLVNLAVSDLAKHMNGQGNQAKLNLKEIKLLMDSLSQAHKILLTLPGGKVVEPGVPAELLKYLTMEQLKELAEIEAEMEAMFEKAKAAKLAEEKEYGPPPPNITPMRYGKEHTK